MLAYFIILAGVLNLIRIFIYVLASLKFTLWSKSSQNEAARFSFRNKDLFPEVLVVVPAYNEAKTIQRTLDSLNHVYYPKNKLRITIVDDGSSDGTKDVVRSIIRKRSKMNFGFNLLVKKNGGKADALNYAIRKNPFGELITCLDADSTVERDFFIQMVKYFKFNKVCVAAANVQVNHGNTLIGLFQSFEYLISYQMKKAQSYLNIEYIVGGIGSTFRRSTVEEVGLYDTNTVTEDIDLSVKIINHFGSKDALVIYANDAIARSQPVLKFKELILQRYRWKFGRMQTLYKNKALIFNRNKKYNRILTFLVLPLAIFGEATLIFDFLVMLLIFAYALVELSPQDILTPIFLTLGYILYNIWWSDTTPKKERLVLALSSPVMIVGNIFLTFVEFVALIKSLPRASKIKKTLQDKTSWSSPTRV